MKKILVLLIILILLLSAAAALYGGRDRFFSFAAARIVDTLSRKHNLNIVYSSMSYTLPYTLVFHDLKIRKIEGANVKKGYIKKFTVRINPIKVLFKKEYDMGNLFSGYL